MATKPFYMLSGEINLMKELPIDVDGQPCNEKHYYDEHGDKAIVVVPDDGVFPRRPWYRAEQRS